jgi:hypothetical protein
MVACLLNDLLLFVHRLMPPGPHLGLLPCWLGMANVERLNSNDTSCAKRVVPKHCADKLEFKIEISCRRYWTPLLFEYITYVRLCLSPKRQICPAAILIVRVCYHSNFHYPNVLRNDLFVHSVSRWFLLFDT